MSRVKFSFAYRLCIKEYVIMFLCKFIFTPSAYIIPPNNFITKVLLSKDIV